MRSTIVQAVRRIAAGAGLACAVATAAQAQSAPQSPQPDDPFARRGWHLELGGHGAFETWNYNLSREELYGFRAGITYGLGKGLTLVAGSPLYHVSQRGIDGYALGATAGIRGRIYRRGRLSVFWEFEVGISEADTNVPPRGTRFNYLALGGGGTTVRLRSGVHLLTGLKWIHISNNGLAGRSRNPDIEAVGPHTTLLLRF
jgi:opacity protein-like surface antigen